MTADERRTETVHWRADDLGKIAIGPGHVAPLIREGDFCRIGSEIDLWDAWPVQRDDGHPAQVAPGVTLWIALAAPRYPDPDERHCHARLHLLQRARGHWTHLGRLLPEDFSPGSREWSGSAVLDANGGLTLHFTAAGRRGERRPTFEQRMFGARARLEPHEGLWRFRDWRDLVETVACDQAMYMATAGAAGAPGTIKAFRDPAYFRDPLSGDRYLFFAGSQGGSQSAFNGVVGAAIARAGERWELLPPIVSADGLNNELERPHVVHHAGAYYLFWSTQSHVFDPTGPVGPTGLYGMVSGRIHGRWRPLNGSGLVFANPPEAPAQAYSWLVLPDLTVASFVDDWGLAGNGRERRFGGAFAPFLRLELDGDRARLAG